MTLRTIVFCLLCCIRTFAYADLAASDQAFEKGDYAAVLKLAKQGDPEAQFLLGQMYVSGLGGEIGLPVDYQEAVKWYRPAANQGNSVAQFSLGLMYEHGKGVPQDYVQAHMWYNLAAVSGDATSIKNRDLIVEKMPPMQIAEAQRLAREWKPTKPDLKKQAVDAGLAPMGAPAVIESGSAPAVR